MARLSRDQAQRLALAAQGFNGGRPNGRVDVRHFRKVVDRLGVIQLDSVNVFSRTHYLPFFSRLGAYPRDLIDSTARGRRRLTFEDWAHEASLLPLELQPLMRWRSSRGMPSRSEITVTGKG